jgi:hypothetical protein
VAEQNSAIGAVLKRYASRYAFSAILNSLDRRLEKKPPLATGSTAKRQSA